MTEHLFEVITALLTGIVGFMQWQLQSLKADRREALKMVEKRIDTLEDRVSDDARYARHELREVHNSLNEIYFNLSKKK